MHCTEFSQWLVSIRSPLAGNRNHSKTQNTYNTMILYTLYQSHYMTMSVFTELS